MNIADLLSLTLQTDTSLYFDYPIKKINYNFNEINLSEVSFYNKVWNFLKNPYFKNRLLLIGKSELFDLIPYILHQKDRKIIYGPFLIKDDIKEFFKYFKIGNPEKSIAIYSTNLSKIEKENIKYWRIFQFHC